MLDRTVEILFHFSDFAGLFRSRRAGQKGIALLEVFLGGNRVLQFELEPSAQRQHGRAIALLFRRPIFLRNLWRFLPRRTAIDEVEDARGIVGGAAESDFVAA